MDNNLRIVRPKEIDDHFLDGFNRDQDVTKCWRKEDDKWVIKDIEFQEHWDEERKKDKIEELREEMKAGGSLICAYENEALKGYALVGNELFGSEKQYVQLFVIYVSQESRGKGIGKILFEEIIEDARKTGAKKLYISASSAIETTAFYLARGCVDTEEIDERLFDREPCDRHLELAL